MNVLNRLWITHIFGAIALSGCGLSIHIQSEAVSISPSLSPTLQAQEFYKQFGGAGAMTLSTGMDADDDGNIYSFGLATGAVDTTSPIGSYDIIFTKYSADGQRQWITRYGVPGGIIVPNRLHYHGGFLYGVGYTQSALDGNSLNGVTDLMILKYDTDGNKIWIKQIGVATLQAQGTDLKIDSAGNIYAVGLTNASFDGHPVTGSSDALLVKFDADGNKLWSQQIGNAGVMTQGSAVGLDGSGNIYVTGAMLGGLDGHAQVGVLDGYLIKYNSAGVKQWSQAWGAAGTAQYPVAMDTDSSGNCYISGFADGALDGQTVTGVRDQSLIKFNSAGVKQWTRFHGVAGAIQSGYSVKIDPSGRINLIGGDDPNSGTTGAWSVTRWNASGSLIDQFHGASSTSGLLDAVFDSNGFMRAVGFTTSGLEGQTQNGVVDTFVLLKQLH